MRLLHGTKDSTVPAHSSEQLHAALARARPRPRLALLHDAPHMAPVLSLMDDTHPLHRLVLQSLVR